MLPKSDSLIPLSSHFGGTRLITSDAIRIDPAYRPLTMSFSCNCPGGFTTLVMLDDWLLQLYVNKLTCVIISARSNTHWPMFECLFAQKTFAYQVEISTPVCATATGITSCNQMLSRNVSSGFMSNINVWCSPGWPARKTCWLDVTGSTVVRFPIRCGATLHRFPITSISDRASMYSKLPLRSKVPQPVSADLWKFVLFCKPHEEGNIDFVWTGDQKFSERCEYFNTNTDLLIKIVVWHCETILDATVLAKLRYSFS